MAKEIRLFEFEAIHKPAVPCGYGYGHPIILKLHAYDLDSAWRDVKATWVDCEDFKLRKALEETRRADAP